MATQKEKQSLLDKYLTLDKMHSDAVINNNTSDIYDIELQMKKVRIQLAALGEVANPIQSTDEQSS